MNETRYLVDDPKIINLINEVKDGARPITELYNELNKKYGYGRRTTDRILDRMRVISKNLAYEFKDYARNPWKHEFEFLLYCMGIRDGRRKNMFKLNECIEVRQNSPETMTIIIKHDKLENNTPDHYPYSSTT